MGQIFIFVDEMVRVLTERCALTIRIQAVENALRAEYEKSCYDFNSIQVIRIIEFH